MKPSIKIIGITLYFLILLILCTEVTLADDSGKELKEGQIETIPGVGVEQFKAREEAKEDIIEIKQDLEKEPLISIPQPIPIPSPEEELSRYRDLLNSVKDGSISVPDESKVIHPSEDIGAERTNQLPGPITPIPIPPPPQPTHWIGPISFNPPPSSPIITPPFLSSYTQRGAFNDYYKNYPRFGASFFMNMSLKKTYNLSSGDDEEDDIFYSIY